jgi:hypothetical protein
LEQVVAVEQVLHLQQPLSQKAVVVAVVALGFVIFLMLLI